MNNLIFLFIWIASTVFADDKSHFAEAYYDTQQFSEAQALYESALMMDLEPWQRNILLFDIGTSQLSSGSSEEAIETFNNISLGDDPQPEIERRLNMNLALANIDVAAKNHSVQLIKEALAAIQEAQNAECKISKFRGDPCMISPEILAIKAKAKQVFLEIAPKEVDDFINSLEHHPWLAILIEELNLSLKDITAKNSFVESAIKNKEAALKALKENRPHLAKAHLRLALTNLKIMLLKNEEITPISVLENGIAAQKLLIPLTPELNPSIQDDLMHLQQHVLTLVQPFIPAVLKHEEELVHLHQQDLFRKICIKEPWEEVMPLFQEGHDAAEKAALMIGLSYPHLEITAQQKEVVRNWEKALHLLKSTPPEDQEKQQQGLSSKPALNEVFDLLEQMEKEDKLSPPIQGGERKVHRPW